MVFINNIKHFKKGRIKLIEVYLRLEVNINQLKLLLKTKYKVSIKISEAYKIHFSPLNFKLHLIVKQEILKLVFILKLIFFLIFN